MTHPNQRKFDPSTMSDEELARTGFTMIYILLGQRACVALRDILARYPARPTGGGGS